MQSNLGLASRVLNGVSARCQQGRSPVVGGGLVQQLGDKNLNTYGNSSFLPVTPNQPIHHLYKSMSKDTNFKIENLKQPPRPISLDIWEAESTTWRRDCHTLHLWWGKEPLSPDSRSSPVPIPLSRWYSPVKCHALWPTVQLLLAHWKHQLSFLSALILPGPLCYSNVQCVSKSISEVKNVKAVYQSN